MNWHAVRAIYRFEMARALRTLGQSVVSPVISTSLYFVVFGAGIWFLFKLFGQTPRPEEHGPQADKPIRTAGITPAPSTQRGPDASPQPQPAE